MATDLNRDWSDEFPILHRLHFMNHAGVAPICGAAARAMGGYIKQAQEGAYYQSNWYKRAYEVKKSAAKLIGAGGPGEIAFIPNTSTGLSLVAKGLQWYEGDNVVITGVEYPANRYPWEDLKRFGVEFRTVEQREDGRIDMEEVVEAINDRTRVVSLSHVQYASGFRADLRPVSDMVHRARGFLCVDAIQSLGVLPVDVEELGIDFLSADGHKWLLSPEGCGIFYCRKSRLEELHPNVVGWMNMVDATDYGRYQFKFEADARRFEPGSYNIPGVLAMGASMEMFLELGMDRVWEKVRELTDYLCAGLTGKGYRVFSPRGKGESSGIVAFEPRGSGEMGIGAKKLVADLEAKGFVTVVRGNRVRISPHFYNTLVQMDALLAALP